MTAQYRPGAGLTLRWLVLLLVGCLIAYGGLSVAMDHGAAGSMSAVRMLVVASRDRDDPVVRNTVDRFRKSGFVATDDVDRAITRALAADPPGALLVTRSVFASVPPTARQELYGRGDIVGGLDVSLYELQPLADPLGSTGSARLHYTPERPIFSLMFSFVPAYRLEWALPSLSVVCSTRTSMPLRSARLAGC